MTTATTAASPSRIPWRTLAWLIPIAALLIVAPLVLDEFLTLTLMYGLIFAIAALGFNLLLGYTGLLSFGHSAFFGGGAYTVAFMVKYLKIASMELFLAGSILANAILSVLFGFVCVRYTRIFFGILTLAL
jgi:branched-chain amino acid transport system permease protein